MLSSKSKSGLSESTLKNSPARVSKLSKGVTKSDADSNSPLRSGRLSIDRSPRSVESKLAERRSPKITTPSDKRRVVKRSTELQTDSKGSTDLQTQLGLVQEDLKKARDRLAALEDERLKAAEELKEAKKIAGDANEKLSEALVAQKRAEENAEIEKFRAVELEEANLEVARKKEVEWEIEIEEVRKQHAIDVALLLSANQELQRVKNELFKASEAKNAALSHADDAMKIAEINAGKVEFLSGELNRLKVAIDAVHASDAEKALIDSKWEAKAKEAADLVKQLESEVESLKQELVRTKIAEEKLAELEAMIEGLKIEVDNAKKSESKAARIAEEWKKKVGLLEIEVEKANRSENILSESLGSMIKQLEESNMSLKETESKVAFLRENVESLQISLGRHRSDLEESDRHLETAKLETISMAKMVESLKSELETMKEDRLQAQNNEKLAASNVQSLLEERNKVITELRASREEEEKSKKAMEDLSLALHELSAESRDVKGKLMVTQTQLADTESEVEDLKQVLRDTERNYQSMLDEAETQIDHARETAERAEIEIKSMKASWDEKERSYLSSGKKSEEEIEAVKRELEILVVSLREEEKEARMAKEDGAKLVDSLKQVESEMGSAKEVAEKVKAESLQLKEILLDKENELQSIAQENDELRTREAAAREKAEELSKLLAEALAKKEEEDENKEENVEEKNGKTEENGELSSGEKEYDIVSKMADCSEESMDKLVVEKPEECSLEHAKEGKNKDSDSCIDAGSLVVKKANGDGKDEDVPMDGQVAAAWESCKVVEKVLSPEREQESVDGELESKIDGESFDRINGLTTESMDNGGSLPSKEQQKKKKALLSKFGSLLRKKSIHK